MDQAAIAETKRVYIANCDQPLQVFLLYTPLCKWHNQKLLEAVTESQTAEALPVAQSALPAQVTWLHAARCSWLKGPVQNTANFALRGGNLKLAYLCIAITASRQALLLAAA